MDYRRLSLCEFSSSVSTNIGFVSKRLGYFFLVMNQTVCFVNLEEYG